ncbi:MAG: hypothetical protein V4551_09825 [Pseudomonadota bacterium]
MKAVSTFLTSALAWSATGAALWAGTAMPPAVAPDDNGNGALALMLVLGVLIVVGGLAKPKPPTDDGG